MKRGGRSSRASGLKVVLFCGGQGLKVPDYQEQIPKPLVRIGDRPVLWHLMRYYAHFGHREFVLCLGSNGHLIKKFFLNYSDGPATDLPLPADHGEPQRMRTDIPDWKITFVDTGIHASVGERLKAVEPYIGDDDTFLANYADCLTDLPLPQLIGFFKSRGTVGTFISVKPSQTVHVVVTGPDGRVKAIEDLNRSGIRVNGGFFVFKREIFKALQAGEDLLEQPFRRLMRRRELTTFPYEGFWVYIDTYKDKQRLDDLLLQGQAPWQVWQPPTDAARAQ